MDSATEGVKFEGLHIKSRIIWRSRTWFYKGFKRFFISVEKNWSFPDFVHFTSNYEWLQYETIVSAVQIM